MTISDAASRLSGADDILILTHRRPDGDTIGSAAALCRALRGLNKRVFVFLNPEITPRFEPLFDGLAAPAGFQPAFVVSCDVASDELICRNAEVYKDRIDLCIDHHRTNTLNAGEYLLEENSAACGEIVYELIRALEAPFDLKTAEAIYVAISTDTGCFKYSNTKARTLRIAADCYEAGIPASEINREFFESKTQARFEVERYVFDNLHFYKDGRIAICLLPRAVIDSTGATEDDLENLAALPRQIRGVCAGIMISETINGNSKISVRTSYGYDAAGICARFGGGGHERAAGGSLKGAPAENELTVLEAAVQCIEESL